MGEKAMKAPMGKAIMQKYHPDQDERGRVAPMNEDNGGDYYLVTDFDSHALPPFY